LKGREHWKKVAIKPGEKALTRKIGIKT